MSHRTCHGAAALLAMVAYAAAAGCTTVGTPAHGPAAAHGPAGPHEACPAYFESGRWTLDTYGPVLELTPTACGRTVTTTEEIALLENEMTKKFWQGRHLDNVYGLYNQLECHILLYPTKPTWNLEPGRAFVGLAATINAQCNPSSSLPEPSYY